MEYKFIEIGTSDFETLMEKKSGEIGISIEPIPFYLKNLPDNPCVIKLNCAISDYDGKADVFWVDPEDIILYDLPVYIRGCNSIIEPHKTTVRELSERGLEHLLKKGTCDVLSWNTFVFRYDVKKVDFLKIDTEGHDCLIINSILFSSSGILPSRIKFETNILTPSHVLEETIKNLFSFGYEIEERDDFNLTVKRHENR